MVYDNRIGVEFNDTDGISFIGNSIYENTSKIIKGKNLKRVTGI